MNVVATGTELPQGEENKDDNVVTPAPDEGTNQEQPPIGPQGEEPAPGKKRTGFQKRMAQHQEELETARLEADFWKREALKATAPTEKTAAKTRLDFDSDDEWLEHRLTVERQELVKEAREQAAEQARLERLAEGYTAKIAEAKKDHPDWDEVFAQADGATLPHEAILFCLESPAGAKIAYHLAKNEEAYEAFIKLPPNRQAVELGRLEERLSKKPVQQQEAVKRTTAAPSKLTDVRGGGTSAPTGADRFSSKEAWRQWRNTPKNAR